MKRGLFLVTIFMALSVLACDLGAPMEPPTPYPTSTPYPTPTRETATPEPNQEVSMGGLSRQQLREIASACPQLLNFQRAGGMNHVYTP